MPDPRIIKAENKVQAQSETIARKAAYRRLLQDPDFKYFYDYLEMCYNSYMDQGGALELPKDSRDFINAQSNMLYKILEHLKRQAK